MEFNGSIMADSALGNAPAGDKIVFRYGKKASLDKETFDGNIAPHYRIQETVPDLTGLNGGIQG